MSEKIKILAVDDEAFNLDIMTEYLQEAQYNVVGADDGDTALEKLKENPDISVIILDRMMPRMDGMQFLKKIQNDPILSKIPVIMQTAAAAPIQVLEGLQAGVYAYIKKPYEDNELLDVVARALRR